MTQFFGYKRLTTANDWREIVGDDKWRATRSAYELAHCWHQSGGLPSPIASALNASGYEALEGLSIDLCLVEKPVFLDTKNAPSMTDLMAYGKNANGDVIVTAVEGKASEPFASTVRVWVRGDGEATTLTSLPRPTRMNRLAFLCKHLGKTLSPESELRYQLLHRTVSAVLEAQLHGAAAALVLVHAFGADAAGNFDDFSRFVREIGDREVREGAVAGPCHLGEHRDMPTYFLWWQQAVAGAT